MGLDMKQTIIMVVLAAMPGWAASFNVTFDVINEGVALSGNGKVIAGIHSSLRRAAYWTESEGVVMLGDLTGQDTYSVATAISYDGSVIVGYCSAANEGMIPFRWTKATGIRRIGPVNFSGYASAVSDNGMCVAVHGGVSGISLFRWTGAGGLELLGERARPISISEDGTIILGEDYRWSLAAGFEPLPTIDGAPTIPSDMTPDGSIVVGAYYDGSGSQVFKWSHSGGVQTIGLAGGWPSTSANGSKIVAWNPNLGNVVWTESRGVRSLQGLLQDDHGLDLSPWILYSAVISNDGMTFAGLGREIASNSIMTWIVHLEGDSDGDGLLDSWETNGIDIDGDGTIDLNLPAMGADPEHKDLFVEVDILAGQNFPARSRNLVSKAFRDALVHNPDGADGINLHIMVDEQNLVSPESPWVTVANGWAPVFDTLKAAHFGTVANRASLNKDNILASRKRAFRYCIIADRIDDRSLGTSELPGNDFFTTMGEKNPPVTDTLRAAVFMHEFGHTLGLRHGGGDGINGKPNYISIMNYLLSVPLDFSTSFWKMDYSRVQLDSLDEKNLEELTGIRYQGLPYVPFSNIVMPYGYTDTDPNGTRVVSFARIDGTEVDWNGNGILPDPGTVGQDINYLGGITPYFNTFSIPSPDQSMDGYNDWTNLLYAVGTTGDYADMEHTTVTDDKTTPELIQYLNDTIPAIAATGDINADGMVNEEDFALLAAAWLAEVGDENWNHACDIARPPDEVIDLMDLTILAQRWMTGVK